MATVTVTILAMWLILLLAPETPVSRTLHRLVVAAPAARLARITRGQVLFAVLLVVACCALVWWMEADGVRLLGMAAPDVAAWAMTFEVTSYLDVVVAAAMAASTVRLRAIGTRAVALVSRARRAAPRSARARQTLRPRRPDADNDDDRGDAVRLASLRRQTRKGAPDRSEAPCNPLGMNSVAVAG